MIASNKYRQERNDFATIQRTNLEGAHERSKSAQFVKRSPNANPDENDNVVIKD